MVRLCGFVYLEVAWLFGFGSSADGVWVPGHLAVGSDPADLVSLIEILFVVVHVDVAGSLFDISFLFFRGSVNSVVIFFFFPR